MWNWLSFLKASLYAQGSWSYDDLYGERIPRGDELDLTLGGFAICVGIYLLAPLAVYWLYHKVKKIYFVLICIAFYVALAIFTTEIIVGKPAEKSLLDLDQFFVPYPFISCLFLGLFIFRGFWSLLCDILEEYATDPDTFPRKEIPIPKTHKIIINICMGISIAFSMSLYLVGFGFVILTGLLLLCSVFSFWWAIKFFPFLIGVIAVVWISYWWHEKYSKQYTKTEQ